jgi:hypothetical protein
MRQSFAWSMFATLAGTFAILAFAYCYGNGAGVANAKDMAGAITPIVSILVAVIFFYLYPSHRASRDTSLALIQSYLAADMAIARRVAWLRLKNLQDHEKTFVDHEFVSYVVKDTAPGKDHEVFQAIQRVFDFYALLDDTVREGLVDDKIIRATLSYYYASWGKPIRELGTAVRSLDLTQPGAVLPKWAKEKALDNLEKVMDKAGASERASIRRSPRGP